MKRKNITGLLKIIVSVLLAGAGFHWVCTGMSNHRPASGILHLVNRGNVDPPFNHVQMKHSHNSYQRREVLYDQAKQFMIRSFELDLHITKPGEKPSNDWFVYHRSDDQESNYRYLSDALRDLKRFHDENPHHEVITVWIEMKDGFGAGPFVPAGLDATIRNVLSDENIYTPRKLLERSEETTLRAAVMRHGWPSLSHLRGLFLFVILGKAADYEKHYDSLRSLMFLSDTADAVFLNVNLDYTIKQFEAGLVNRLTEAERSFVENPVDVWVEALEKKIQYLGTDKINYTADPWATTNNINGWPFRTIFDDSSMMKDDLESDMFPQGFPCQVYWGRRATGTGYAGRSEWFADVNGDGRSDHVNNSDGTRDYYVMLSTGSGFTTDACWGRRTSGVGNAGQSEWFVDVNGDGKADHVYNKDGTGDYCVMLSTGSGFTTDTCLGSRLYAIGNSGHSEWFVDVNGDGKADHVYNKDGTGDYYVMLSTGSGFTTDTCWGSRLNAIGNAGLSEWFVDVNGDGKGDHVYNKDGTGDYCVMLSTGSGFTTDTYLGSRLYAVGSEGRAGWFFDVNGDGMADHVYSRDGTAEYRVMFSTGRAFAADKIAGSRKYDVGFSGYAEWFVDINGDGMADHVYNRRNTHHYYVQYNTGSGFGPDVFFSTRVGGVGYKGRSEWFVDINGDGMGDHVSNRNGTRELWVRMSKQGKD